MNQKLSILLVIVLIIAVIGVLVISGILPMFTLVSSGKIQVIDDFGNKVSGATVEAVATLSLFHYYGDVWDKNTNQPATDGVIDTYDVKYMNQTFGQVDVTWADMDGDGKYTMADMTWVIDHCGLTVEKTKCSNVTIQDGTCTLSYYPVLRTDVSVLYSVTVSKSGYHSTTKNLNLKSGGQITIETNRLPTAVIEYSPQNPMVNQIVTFDGSKSQDIDGQIKSYKWTLIDTYNTTHYYYTASFTYTFNKGGQATVTLTVTDDLEGQGSTTETVKIGSYNVIALIDANPTSGSAPLTVTFDANRSYDPDNPSTDPTKGIVSYKWDFGDKATGSGVRVSHTYQSPGTYVASLTVTDDEGTTDTATVTITVTSPEIIVDWWCSQYPSGVPPSTNVIITLCAKSKTTGQPMSNIGLTIIIMPKSEANYVGYTQGGVTGTDGIANIEILTPPSSKYSPYNMTVSYEGKIIACFNLYVLPQLAVKVISFNYEQVYKPGDYDFIYTGSIVDKESMSEPISDFSAYSITLKDEKGTTIPFEYTSYSVSASTFTFKAKVYDYYKSYTEHTLTLTITFRKTGFIDGTLTATAKMTAPTVMAIVESSSVTVGKNTFTIAFRDKYGQPYTGITEQNIEVIITDPNGVSMSTANELKDKYYFNDVDKAITIVYTFDKVGTYKVVVKYSGLPFYQDPSTFTVTSSEAPSPIPSILTNPFVIGFIALIFLILIFRRRRH